jgi:predicted nucleotidyltransferase
MRKDPDDIKKLLKEYFLSQSDVVLVILYGSAAGGRLSAGSDVDIALAGKDVFSVDRKVEINLDLTKLLGRPVDLRDLRLLHGLILTQVLTKGEVIVKRNPGLLANFMISSVDFHEDMLPNVRMIMEKKAKAFINGS